MANRAAAEPFPSLNIDRVIDPKMRRFQARLGGDGLSLFVPHPRFWARSLYRVAMRGSNKIKIAFAPLHHGIIGAAVGGIVTTLLTSKSGSYARNMWISNVLWDIDSRLPLSKICSNEVRVGYLALLTSGGLMAGITISHRMLLRFLLSYTGWMDEGRGKRSIKTTVWGMLLKYVYMYRRPETPTFGLQNCLPKQPVPELRATIDRYLLSMQPLLSDEEYAAVKADSARFLQAEGPTLQRYLKFKYWTSTNYVSDWWLSVVYLRGRESIMINSNYFGLSLYKQPPTSNQAARAATLTRYFMEIKASIDREELPRITMQDIVPICMQQYSGAFSLTREPGREEDRLVQYGSDVSRHVVVMYRGYFYKVALFCHRTGRILSRVQFEAAYNGIIDACDRAATSGTSNGSGAAQPPEALIGACTALPRTEWAAVREDLFLRDKINRVALEIIERAAFVVCLDENPAPYKEIARCGRMALHGTGADRWFDKSFCLVVAKDGMMMVNGEHAWADAPTLGHIFELAMAREARGVVAKTEYAADGSVMPTPQESAALAAGKLTLYRPERILFNMTAPLVEATAVALQKAQLQIEELDLRCMCFDEFGKGAVKKARVSPDAFVQMALQIAYFRDQGHHTQTYESGMARLYCEGRTETIRSASNESAALCRAMDDVSASDADRLKLLKTACEKHARTTALAMTSRGVDRHMFALYVVAVGTQTDSSFLATAMKRGWKLSTSQIPQMVQTFVKKGDFAEYPRPAGGFGPVAKDGYGVCYTMPGDHQMFFHVSANHSSEITNAERMRERIVTALRDLRRVVEAQ